MVYTGPHGIQYPGSEELDSVSDDSGGSGGGGSGGSDSGGSSSDTTFNTGRHTLGTTSLGTSTGSDDSGGSGGGGSDGGVVVEDTSDPDDSSPAGGAGQTSATSRFTGIDEDTVSEMSEEEQLATTQSASDALNDAVSNTDLSPTEAQNVPTARENLDAQSEANQPEQGEQGTQSEANQPEQGEQNAQSEENQPGEGLATDVDISGDNWRGLVVAAVVLLFVFAGGGS
jgi:hypothetical protein